MNKSLYISQTFDSGLRLSLFRRGAQAFILSLLLIPAVIAGIFLMSAEAFALSAEHYAASSRLASGKWVKVGVSTTGIQFISAANLRKMGFADPTKVRAFGFGGRELPMTLTENQPDDLPTAPCIATSKGLYFFAYNNVRWDYAGNLGRTPFTHVGHSYADESWYFLSDSVDSEEMEASESGSSNSGLQEINSFIQPLLHEQDLYHPSNTGSRYLGEDFRSPTRRSFDFNLIDAVDDADCIINVAFASNTTNVSELEIAASGKGGTESYKLNLSSNSESDVFMRYNSTQKTIKAPGNSLKLDLTFRGSGTIQLARLDFIEVQYHRRLKLADGQLYFTLTNASPSIARIEGAENSTIIWDITDARAPKRVATDFSGSSMTFVSPGGFREYVAFTPDKTGYQLSEFTSIGNQDIHSLPVADMLIIAPAEYNEAAAKLAAHHRDHDALSVRILTPEAIYNEFSSGTPDVTAFRRLLKMWYDRGLNSAATPDADADVPESGKIRYCLIMGESTYDNKKKMEMTRKVSYPFVPVWQSATGESQTSSYSTDDYIGMLADASTFDIGRAKLQVAIGRMPFQSAQEASALVDKYIKYVTKPDLGLWRNRIMFLADDQNNGDHLSQSEDMIRAMKNTPSGRNYRYERVYMDSYPIEQSSRGPVYPKAKEKMLELWNNGVVMINYIGHANPVSWTHEDMLNWNDISSFSNSNLPFIYAATCEFGRIDSDTRSGAEVLWAYPESGIIGILTPNRTVYIDQNGLLSKEMGKSLLRQEADGLNRPIGDVMIEAKNNYPRTDNTNKLRYQLIGNPAMRLPVPLHSVRLTSINGVDVESIASSGDLPELKAQSSATLSGEILSPDGSRADNFSGVVEIQLYDAEQVITTLGNGEQGVVSYYNDRKNLLYRGVANVEKGEFEATVLLPSEIGNLYSTAQFLFYAYTPGRLEAHGEYSNLYVYGFDDNASPDADGPTIHSFTLNRDDFTSGGVVHSSPVAMARISDPSGINISDAGIGHKMSLTLDGDTYFNDVNNYYSPDPADHTGGTITYPFSELAPGKHSLKLTVWDNALNSSSATVDFEVAVAKTPEIYSLSTDVNPARDHVNFTLSTDRPKAKVDCRIEVFDLNGRRVWSSESRMSTDLGASLSIPWNLCDPSGVRIPRGIYLYRATIISPEGPTATKSYKLAVTAP